VLLRVVPGKVIKVSSGDADSYHYEVEAGGRAVRRATQSMLPHVT